MGDIGGSWPCLSLAGAKALGGAGQRAVPDRFGGQYAEQVEAGGFLGREDLELMPGTASGVEDLESVLGLHQAQGPFDVLADGVGVGRDAGEAGEIAE